MKKNDFLNQIKSNLKGFEQTEVNEIIAYYEEIIADKMENGFTEIEAINSLGDVDAITNEIKVNIVMKRSEKKSTNTLKNFLIILGICSTPILLPLGITFSVLFFVLFVVLFSLIVSFGASGISVIIAVFVDSIVTIIDGGEIYSIFIKLGLGLISGAILIFFTLELFKLAKILLNKTNKIFLKIIKKKSKKGDELNG